MNANFSSNLEKLISGTSEGKIKWENVNNDAFIWQTKLNGVRINVVLQLVNNIVAFRVFDLGKKETIDEIKSDATSSDISIRLKTLYSMAKESIEQSRFNILDDLLKDL